MGRDVRVIIVWETAMIDLKRVAKAVVALTPYTVSSNKPNRFDATEVCLRRMAKHGYAPRAVIDGGAHLGSFATMAKRVFPEAIVQMVEPQPSCREYLSSMARQPGFAFHACALGATSGTLQMRAKIDEPSTGSSIAETSGEPGTIPVPAETLDKLFATRIQASDRALLKLDLQGYELEALRGASKLIINIEAILIEVSFFRQSYEPPVHSISEFMDLAGFDLYDVAALSSRRRDDRLKQGDLMFVRKGSSLHVDTSWD